MKLSIKERIVITQLYPNQGNLISQTLVRDIDKKIRITQEEMKEIDFNVREDGNSYVWNNEKAKEKEIEFTKSEIDLLKKEVEKLDKENKITQSMLDLCLKIKEY